LLENDKKTSGECIMSWETMSDDLWKCPKCGKEVRIRFRMDDWNRSEYIYGEKGGPTVSSFTDPAPGYCNACGIEMKLNERK
jgi:predicted RNA-binding Zn-ribbon protein involved in translation (DUF1610 family)